MILSFQCIPDVKKDVGVVFGQGKECEMNANSQGSEKDNDWPEFGFRISQSFETFDHFQI